MFPTSALSYRFLILCCSLALATTAPSSAGDVLELRDGRILEGRYQGGTASSIRFETAAGLQVIARDSALALTFGSSPSPAPTPVAEAAPAIAPAPAPAPPPPAPAAGSKMLVPAGTLLLVRLEGPVSSNDKLGQRFTGKLQADLAVNGQRVVASGATVFGRVDEAKKGGRLAGKSSVAFSLSEILVGGMAVPLATTNYSEASANAFRNTARNAAAGAAIGHAFDDDDGAKKGAAVGVGLSALRGGSSVTYPAGTLVEFRLTKAVELVVSP